MENAKTPPGPQHPRHVGDQGRRVRDELQRTEGREHDVEGAVAEGQLRSRRQESRYDDPVLVVDPPAVLQLPVGDVDADRPAAAAQHPARALPGPAADLQHVLAGHVAECAEVVLAHALGTPEETGVAEVLPVRRLVLVGVGVPVGTVGHQ